MASIEEMAEHFALAEVVVQRARSQHAHLDQGRGRVAPARARRSDANPLDALVAANRAGDADRQTTCGRPRPRPSARRWTTRGRRRRSRTARASRLSIAPTARRCRTAFSIGFILCLLISLGCAAASLSAIRAARRGRLLAAGHADRVDTRDSAGGRVRPAATAGLVCSSGAVVGGFLSLYWIFRVHKVEITPSDDLHSSRPAPLRAPLSASALRHHRQPRHDGARRQDRRHEPDQADRLAEPVEGRSAVGRAGNAAGGAADDAGARHVTGDCGLVRLKGRASARPWQQRPG